MLQLLKQVFDRGALANPSHAGYYRHLLFRKMRQ
jgi:hypothetical protein